MADKIMDRVAKYLALAESAEGTPEGERAMEQAMKWSQYHNIDLALARAHNIRKAEASKPERRSHKVAESGWKRVKAERASGIRSEKGNNAPLVDLFLAIAHVYDLRCTISGDRTMVHAVGFPEDHEMAERLFTILAVQMVREAEQGLKAKANMRQVTAPKRKREKIPEDERDWGGWDTKGQQYDLEEGVPAPDRRVVWTYDDTNREHPPPTHRLVEVLDDDGKPVMETKWVSVSDARVWRKNHYAGFVAQIEQRLRREKRQAMREAGIDPGRDDSEKGLALVDKKKQVEEAAEEERKRYVLENGGKELGTYEGTKAAYADHTAQAHGQEAAKRAVTGSEKDLGAV